MGKRLIGLLFSIVSLSIYATSAEQLFDYKQLGLDTPRTSAETAFALRFSDSRDFNCYENGKVVLNFGVNILFTGSTINKAIESQYIQKYKAPFDWKDAPDYIKIEAGIETRMGFKATYVSAGKPLFDSNQSAKYMVIELLNGKKIEFARFGQIPESPFNTKKKLKPFFYYQVEGEPRYECGAINQPD